MCACLRAACKPALRTFALHGGSSACVVSTNKCVTLNRGDLQRLVCPREVVWLNGAPGSGKGTK